VRRRKGLLDEEKFLPPLPEQLPRGVSSLPGYGQTSPVAQGLLGFTGRQPTYSVMDPQAQQMSDAYRLGEQASVASQLYGSMLPFAAASTMASAQRAGSLLSPLTVFHGSPHKFSKFDASKIGTGEGAQAYGHGLYFAENPAVAKSYQSVGGYLSNDPVRMAADTVSSHGSEKKALSHLQSILPPVGETTFTGHTRDQIEKAISAIKSGQHKEVSGSLYTVDLPDEQIAKMVNWDVSINKQPEPIKQVLLPLAQKYGVAKTADVGTLLGWMQREMPASEVSNKLREAGIPGIRYLDQGSRGNYQAQTTYKGKPYGDVVSFATQKQLDDYVAEKTAEGFGVNRLPQSSNFVVFPGEESKLRIMEVNGKPVVIDEEELRRSGLLGVAQ